MNKLRVYLSGATKLVDEDFQSWRDKCLEIGKNGFCPSIKFIDPISYFNYTDKQPNTDKQCIDLFMWLVEKSNILLINLDNSDISCGSVAEVEHAYCNNIPIIGFGNNPKTWYSWAKERCSVTFDCLEDSIYYIDITYGSI